MCILNDALQKTDGKDPGQLAIRGDTMMTGYRGLPEKTASSFHDGWFLTGDAVRLDEQGYVVHVGRMSVDILKRGGYKISAREIEDALATLSELEEVAIFGVADEEWGQVIHAAIVPNKHAPTQDQQQWLTMCTQHLHGTIAPFKFPIHVHVLDALPRNALGKVQKHRLSNKIG
jgi:acyl-CoA synthetase (AMP-forming)/AMP-acid ligase II